MEYQSILFKSAYYFFGIIRPKQKFVKVWNTRRNGQIVVLLQHDVEISEPHGAGCLCDDCEENQGFRKSVSVSQIVTRCDFVNLNGLCAEKIIATIQTQPYDYKIEGDEDAKIDMFNKKFNKIRFKDVSYIVDVSMNGRILNACTRAIRDVRHILGFDDREMGV